MKAIGLTLAFILELIAFASFSCLGLLFSTSRLLHIISFIVLFVALIAFWSRYMAPRASNKFSAPAYYAAKLIIYSCSAVVLFNRCGVVYGSIFVGAVIVDELTLAKHNLSSL